MTTATFDFIGNHPDLIPLIASWHQQQWQHISPELTTNLRIKKYSSYASKPGIPCSILALIEGKPAGSASLVESDMSTHPHLHPWLASVYVDNTFRRQGIASQLIDKIIEISRNIGVETLYLFTPDQSDFYQKRGWKILENYTYNGEQVDIMSFTINPIT